MMQGAAIEIKLPSDPPQVRKPALIDFYNEYHKIGLTPANKSANTELYQILRGIQIGINFETEGETDGETRFINDIYEQAMLWKAQDRQRILMGGKSIRELFTSKESAGKGSANVLNASSLLSPLRKPRIINPSTPTTKGADLELRRAPSNYGTVGSSSAKKALKGVPSERVMMSPAHSRYGRKVADATDLVEAAERLMPGSAAPYVGAAFNATESECYEPPTDLLETGTGLSRVASALPVREPRRSAAPVSSSANPLHLIKPSAASPLPAVSISAEVTQGVIRRNPLISSVKSDEARPAATAPVGRVSVRLAPRTLQNPFAGIAAAASSTTGRDKVVISTNPFQAAINAAASAEASAEVDDSMRSDDSVLI